MKKLAKTLLIGCMSLLLAFGFVGCKDKPCEHTYDNACDVTCNECGEERVITHTPNADDGDCTTAITCKDCGTITTPAKEKHTGGEATCTEKAVCTECNTAYGEVIPDKHVFDNGVCACGSIISTEMTASQLNAAMATLLAAGKTDFSITMTAVPEVEMITAIRRAICDTEGVEDGSINLTLKGVTAIPAHSDRWKGGSMIFGRVIQDENGEYFDEPEVVTELASVNLPDVLTIGKDAFSGCENLVSVTAPKLQTIGKYAFAWTGLTYVDFPEVTTIEYAAFYQCSDIIEFNLPKVTVLDQLALDTCDSKMTIYLTSADEIVADEDCFYWLVNNEILETKVSLILNSNKQSQVNGNTWTTKDANGKDVSFTFKDIQFMCSNGTAKHTYETLANNGDGTHTFTCTTCNVTITEGCRGGEATCSELATCEVCGAKYGELSGHILNSATGYCKFGCGEFLANAKVTLGETTTYYEEVKHFKRYEQDGAVITLLQSAEDTTSRLSVSYTLNLNGYDLPGVPGTYGYYSMYVFGTQKHASLINTAADRAAIDVAMISGSGNRLTIGSNVDITEIYIAVAESFVDLSDADFTSTTIRINEGGFNTSQITLGSYAVYDAAGNVVTGELIQGVTYTIKAAQ